MSCEYLRDKDGKVLAIVCGLRKQPACAFCGQPSTKQCDYLEGAKTCDAYMCDGCTVPVGPNLDHCLGHSRVGKCYRVVEGRHAGHVMQLLAWRKVRKYSGSHSLVWKYASQCSCIAAGDLEPSHLKLLDLTAEVLPATNVASNLP